MEERRQKQNNLTFDEVSVDGGPGVPVQGGQQADGSGRVLRLPRHHLQLLVQLIHAQRPPLAPVHLQGEYLQTRRLKHVT